MNAPTRPAPAGPVLPRALVVQQIVHETADIATLVLDDSANPRPFQPGQFNMLVRDGVGEAAIPMSGDAVEPSRLVHTVRAVSPLTRELCSLSPGDVVGVRGPYGRGWPVQAAEGGDVLVVAGGIGLAPLRPAIFQILRNRDRYGRLLILVGASHPADLLYVDQLRRWRSRRDTRVEVAVDRSDGHWDGAIGPVTTLIDKVRFDPGRTTVLACGPDAMMRASADIVVARGVAPTAVHLAADGARRIVDASQLDSPTVATPVSETAGTRR